MFVPPMLCTILRDPALLAEPRYVAELKLDGQRARFTSQAAYSWRGLTEGPESWTGLTEGA